MAPPDRRGVPVQFVFRAIAVIVGIGLLLVVAHGAARYVAFSLIALALLTEAAATIVYWRRSRR